MCTETTAEHVHASSRQLRGEGAQHRGCRTRGRWKTRSTPLRDSSLIASVRTRLSAARLHGCAVRVVIECECVHGYCARKYTIVFPSFLRSTFLRPVQLDELKIEPYSFKGFFQRTLSAIFHSRVRSYVYLCSSNARTKFRVQFGTREIELYSRMVFLWNITGYFG